MGLKEPKEIMNIGIEIFDTDDNDDVVNLICEIVKIANDNMFSVVHPEELIKKYIE